MFPTRLETDRLVLRRPEKTDAAAIQKILEQEFVRKYNCLGTPLSIEKVEGLLTGQPGQLVLTRKEDGAVIGHVSAQPDDLRYKVDAVALSYYLGEAYTRKGCMTEALGRVIKYVFHETTAQVVSARTFVENAACIALLEKLGFTQEGILRRAVLDSYGQIHDDILFSLLREEYLPAHPPKLGDRVKIRMDRPIGTVHPKHPDLVYPINYGYVPGLTAPDGEEQDAYVLGVGEPLEEFTGRLIAVIHRFDDVEEKWVLAPEGMEFTREQVERETHFQEQYYHTEIRMGAPGREAGHGSD